MTLGVYFAPTAHGLHGLLDYLFGAGIGTNIGASLVWGSAAGFIGYFVARKVRAAFQRIHEHNEWSARQLARLHLHVTGRHADQHPHHADIGRPTETP
jgi:hypothetical protein